MPSTISKFLHKPGKSCISVVTGIIILTSVWCIHAQTLDLPAPLNDTLGNWYNLGRVSGSKTYTNCLVPYFNDGFALIDLYHYSSGNTHIETGISALSLFGSSGNSGAFLVMLPEIDIAAAPSPGNRLSATIASANLYFAAVGGVHIGFEDPLYFANSYSWDYLSRQGVIRVAPDQYENSFFFGPQLNAGQVRTHVDIGHSIQIDPDRYPKYFLANSGLGVGILDNVAINGKFSYLHNNGYSYQYSTRYIYSNYYYSKLDSIYASGFFSVRTVPLTLSLGYSYSHPRYTDEYDPYYYYQKTNFHEFHVHRTYGDLTFTTGKRIQSLSEVNGNWDGYFTPLLGTRQFMAHFRPEVVFIKNPSDGDPRAFSVDNTMGFGLNSFLTIGEKGKIQVSSNVRPFYDVSLTATLSNIPLRSRGPEQVSKFEYVFGYWPRKGEFRIDGAFKLPFFKNSSEVFRTQPVIDYMINNPLGTLSDVNGLNQVSHNSISTFAQSILNDSDHRLKITAGATDRLIIENNFEVKTVSTYRYGYYYMNTGVASSGKNTIFADRISFYIGHVDQYLHSLSTALFLQTGSATSGRERFDFLLSYIFTLGY